jgi:hypothetical protein
MLSTLVKIAKSDLTSRVVRNSITGNSNVRSIKGKEPSSLLPSGLVNFFGSLFGHVMNFGGWLISGIFGGIAFTFTGAWSLISQTLLQLYYFDWNITDQSIDQLLSQQKAILAGQAGETIGNLLGYLVCGIAPSAAIFAFNEPLGAYLLKEVGEEALDEFITNLQQLLLMSFRMGVQKIAFETYKNIRRNVRNLVKDPNSSTSRAVKNLFGANVLKALQGWGTTNKPWSFATAIEEWTESFNNPVIENFLEELIESFIDSCIEAGYVVAGGLDSWVIQQKLAKSDSQFGEETTVEIIPNREAEDERIILSGPRELLKQEIVSTMRTHELLENRDVGMIFGIDTFQHIRDNPTNNPNEVTLHIQFYGVPEPPWKRNGNHSKRAQTSVPNVDRSKLDWSAIKLACGGANGYFWGRFKGLAVLGDNTDAVVDTMSMFAGSPEEAEQRLVALAALSDYKIITINVTEERKFGKRATNSGLYKETTKVYPAYFTLLNNQKILNQANGRSTLSGTYQKKKTKILLWPDTKPSDFEQTIAELLKDT